MNNSTIKFIGKYALILTIFYVIEFLTAQLIQYGIKEMGADDLYSYMPMFLMVFSFLLNVVTAIIVSSDKKKLNIVGKYAVLLTLFYRPVGVVLFLLYLINGDLNEK